jgi:hypothetical protein
MGEKVEINKPFSYENYGDQKILTQVTTAAVGRIKSQQCTVRRTTLLTSVNKFHDKIWEDILQTAATFMPSVAAKKCGQSTPAPSSDAFEDVTPAEILVLSDDDCSDTEPRLYETDTESNRDDDKVVDSDDE